MSTEPPGQSVVTPVSASSGMGEFGRRESAAAGRAPIALASVIYAVLVGIIWGVHGFHSGMGFETGFAHTSMHNTWWNGFLYLGDPLRIHTSTFYQVSYLLGKIFGIDGSYVPYQLVYAALWWGRGLLVFLILRRFFPSTPLIPYVAGGLVLLHASDLALGWVGQLNQFGFIFWMLLAFYLLLEAFLADTTVAAIALAFGACFFEQMSLLSYEGQLLLLLIFPVLLAFKTAGRWRRLIVLSAAWYVFPAGYIYFTVKRYLHGSGLVYQETVMRKDWSATGLVSDWWFNIAASLEFWRWPRNGLETSVSLAVAAALILAGGGVAILFWTKRDRRAGMFLEAGSAWLRLLAAGIVAVILSFPVYLLLAAPRSLWRTQMLSGIGASLVFTALLGLVSIQLPRRAAKATVLLAGGTAIAYCGSLTALQLGAWHRGMWERHRTAIIEVLRLAPSVKPGTVIVLTDVPKDGDPFEDQVWFDVALRLVYPGIPVTGVYYYSDGTRAPGDPLDAAKGRDLIVANTVVIRYDRSGNGSLEDAFPRFLCLQACATELYSPSTRITGPIAPSAVRRYRVGAR